MTNVQRAFLEAEAGYCRTIGHRPDCDELCASRFTQATKALVAEIQSSEARSSRDWKELYEATYAVWMAFLAGSEQELQATLKYLSGFMYELHESSLATDSDSESSPA